MSRRELAAHPASPPRGDVRVAAEIAVDADRLVVAFELTGNLAALRLPAPSPAPRRRSHLWEHTCVEAFLAPSAGTAYLELNVSPAGDWALWAFDAYRAGMRAAPPSRDPALEIDRGEDRVRIAVSLAGRDVAALLSAPVAVAGLAAVLEEADGRLTYWACAHGGDRPDFHRRETWPIAIYAGASP